MWDRLEIMVDIGAVNFKIVIIYGNGRVGCYLVRD